MGTESLIRDVWAAILKRDDINAEDHFFKLGGDSIRVMMFVSAFSKRYGTDLAPQLVFEHPILEDLALAIDNNIDSNRVLLLSEDSQPLSRDHKTMFMWPGLGGLPLGLSALAEEIGCNEMDVYGIQTHGLNSGEELLSNVRQMASADIGFIPNDSEVHLLGYSFGCRVAFTTALMMMEAGHPPNSLTLLCPGNPTLGHGIEQSGERDGSVRNPEFLGMLLSIFEYPLRIDFFDEAWGNVKSLRDISEFISRRYPNLQIDLISRIVELVSATYQYDYAFEEFKDFSNDFPILLVKASGDQYSAIDDIVRDSSLGIDVVDVSCDHYQVLERPFVAEIGSLVRSYCIDK